MGGEVVGFRNGYWRIHYEDGDRENMSRKDMMRWTVEFGMSCQEILSGIETMDTLMTRVLFVQGTE